jgi:hypothetical protein
MENNTKIAIGLAAAVVVGYIVYKSKKPKSQVTNPVTSVYPEGLKEGDYIQVGEGGGGQLNFFVLQGGKKIPLSIDWVQKNSQSKGISTDELYNIVMEKAIKIENAVGDKIPVG